MEQNETLVSTGTLPDSIWSDFARNWEQEAGVIPDALPGPLVPAERMLEALVEAAERFRAGDESVQFVFFRDGQVAKDCADWLPNAEDRSIREYVDRVERQTGGEFTVLLANPHFYHRELWYSVRRMLRGLFRQVGIPCGGVDTAIFLGRYSKTPFGVHRGQMSVMTFPTDCVKTFRLWRRGYGEAHPDIVDSLAYDAHLADSFSLSARPQDILYWPADVWHIAEGSEEHTATCNVGFWWDRPSMVRTLLELSEQLAAEVGADDPSGLSFPLEAPTHPRAGNGHPEAAPPRPVRESLEQLRRVVNEGSLDRALALEWLRIQSADGFRDVPAPAPEGSVVLHDHDVVAGGTDAPILWSVAGGGELHLAANGYAFVVHDTPDLRRLLASLAAGEPLTVGSQPAEVRDLLTQLARVGALESASPAGRP